MSGPAQVFSEWLRNPVVRREVTSAQRVGEVRSGTTGDINKMANRGVLQILQNQRKRIRPPNRKQWPKRCEP